MSDSEQKTLKLAVESRQIHLKIFIRAVAIVDMVHIIFPICFFGNLTVAGVVTLIVPIPNKNDRQRTLIYFIPVCVVANVILSYGIVISIKLFNCTDPDMRPSKSAKMAMYWWGYTIVLLLFMIFASSYYFFMSTTYDDFLGFLFSFMLNFSISIKTISLYLVRKFIREMRNMEVRVAPAESRTIITRTPLVIQKQHQMRLLAKAVAIVDLIQNSFMLLTMLCVCVNHVLVMQKLSAKDKWYAIAILIFILGLIGIFGYACRIGFKLFKAADRIVDIQHLKEMSPDLQLKYNKIFRNWLIVSVGCLVCVELHCLLLAIFRGNLLAVFYMGGLSLSFAMRVVSVYFIRRFKKDFWREIEERASDVEIRNSIDPNPKDLQRVKKSIVSFQETAQFSESTESEQVATEPSETSELSEASQKREPVAGTKASSSALKSKPLPLAESDTSQSSEPVPKSVPAPVLPLPPPPLQPEPPELSSKELKTPRPSPSQYFRSLVEQKESLSDLFLWRSTED